VAAASFSQPHTRVRIFNLASSRFIVFVKKQRTIAFANESLFSQFPRQLIAIKMPSDPSCSSFLRGGAPSSPRATEEDEAGSQGTSTSLLPSWTGTADASGSGGFGSRQNRIAFSLGILLARSLRSRRLQASQPVIYLEGYLQGKDEGDVEGLVDRVGVMDVRLVLEAVLSTA
jgi:hypothetical protein